MRTSLSWRTLGRAPARPGRRVIGSLLIALPALVSLVACSGGSPAVPSQPTVQAVATQASGAASPAVATVQALAPTVQAAASPVAGTAQAAAGAVAGTAVAAVSPVATALASPSPAAQVPVRITDASLSDATPWVSLHNDGTAPVDVGGWHLIVGTEMAMIPEGATIQPGETLTLHAGDGPSSDREIYLGTSGEALASAAQPGVTVRLTDDDGQVVAQTTVPRVL